MRSTTEDERLVATPGGDRETPPPRKSRLVMVAVVAVLAIAAVAGAWYVSQALIDPGGQSAGELPLLVADASPVKARPDDPGGAEVANRDKYVYKTFVGKPEEQPVEQLLPAPEEPMAKPVDPGPPTVEPLVNAAPETVFPKPTSDGSGETTVVDAAPTQSIKKEPLPPPTAPKTVAQAATSATKEATKETVKPTPVAQAAGPLWIQLAALRDEATAKAEWQRLATRHAAVLGGIKDRVVRADLGAKGVWFRLQAGPFADRASADSACRSLVAAGSACKVAAP